MTWEEKYVRVVTEGGHSQFFQRFVLAAEVVSLVIVAPWIHTLRDEDLTLGDILRTIGKGRVPTTVVMRSTEKEPMNRQAADLLEQCPFVTLHYNDSLHAKIYVCKCQPYGFALLSSANLSGQATRALEVGLMIEGKGAGCEIVDELDILGWEDIPSMGGTVLFSGIDRYTVNRRLRIERESRYGR